MDGNDSRMLYQSYRLDGLPEGWGVEKGLSAVEYLAALEEFIQSYYNFAWSVRDSSKTIGVTFGRETAGMVWVGDVIWNVKATKRQKYESYCALIENLRKEIVLAFTVSKEHLNLFDKLTDRKLLRRMGTAYDIGSIDNKTRLYQSRK